MIRNRKKSPEVSETQYEKDYELPACDENYMFWEYLEIGK